MPRLVAIALALAYLMVSATAAAAAPLEANRQASNNANEIAYDDVTATIETITETSAIRIPEKVRMWVAVVADPAAEIGSRLLGTLRVYLRGDKAMSFAGTFRIVFLNSETAERTSFDTTDSFVLRPRAGMRGHRLDLAFDVPSGTYLYFGRYKPY